MLTVVRAPSLHQHRRGIGEFAVPQGFRWPTDGDYASALIGAVDAMGSEIGVPSSRASVSAPLQTQIAALRGSIETATGLPFGKLLGLAGDVQALSAGGSAGQIAGAIGNLVSDTLDIVASTAEALGVAADMVQVIPIVGQVVGAVFGIIASVFSQPSPAELRAACKQALFNEELIPYCKHLSAISTDFDRTGWDPTTQSVVLSPADQFRPLAFSRAAGDNHYPANLSTVFLALCGGVAGDFSVMSEGRYRQLVTTVRKGSAKLGPVTQHYPQNPNAGMSLATRKQLWKLIQATMACVQPPESTALADQGRAPLPLMMDIAHTAYARGQLDDTLLTLLCNDAFDWTHRRRVCQQGREPVVPHIEANGSCASMVVPDLVRNFNKARQEWGVRLVNLFGDPPQATPIKKVVAGARITIPDVQGGGAAQLAKLGAKGKLSYSPSVVRQMSDALAEIEAAARGKDTGRSLAIVLASLLTGSVGWYAGHRLAQRGAR